jgi:hypothetical protein
MLARTSRGRHVREDGKLGSINVESIGGHLLVHHYLAVTSESGHVVMHSKNTRVYVMHLVPATIEVIWTLKVEPRNSQTCDFHCTVDVRISRLLALVASLGLLQSFLRRHVQGETPLFAADITRKLSGARDNARSVA